MSPEKGPCLKEMNHLPTINFHGKAVRFRGTIFTANLLALRSTSQANLNRMVLVPVLLPPWSKTQKVTKKNCSHTECLTPGEGMVISN